MSGEEGNNSKTATNETPEPFGNFRKWLDVVAKLLAAGAAVIAMLIAQAYESKMSYTSLINQREQAESSLRASMFQNLIDPIIGYTKGKIPDPDRERLLVELLTMNFHNHFEFKPLLVDVSERLGSQNDEAIQKKRWELESVSRRVIDRQINMLRASAELTEDKGDPQDLWFRESCPPPSNIQTCDKQAKGADLPVENAALFCNKSAQTVCVDSPDKVYQVGITVTKADFVKRNVNVTVSISKHSEKPEDRNYKPPFEFELTPFDFPLTDNTQLDLDHRFALTLYGMFEPDKDNKTLCLKFIWFPKGYIPERERPVNYLEMREMLGMEKKH